MGTTDENKGVVVSVNISTEKGTVKKPVTEIVIDAQGVAGDAHAGDWNRQVSLLSDESIKRFAADIDKDIGHGTFAENITAQDLDLGQLRILDHIVIGSVELEVTQLGKSCHGAGCDIFKEVGKCVMPKEGIFCRVIQEGPVKPGDKITLVPRVIRFHVITLSDRASRGEYEDKSGPAVMDCLAGFFEEMRWSTEVEHKILPDDTVALEKELLEACESGVDVIITTGGTGIGSRDIASDVVLRIADKIVPGIMEFIRMKYGDQNPKALISRSVVAIKDKTIIYVLPGSVGAVKEYMSEILKTLEHMLLMLHDIDAH